MHLLPLLLLLAATPALAAEPTLLRLQEIAEREVTNDRFTAHLEGRAEADTAAAAQAALNARMADALARAAAAPAVDAELVAYDVFTRERENAPPRWTATQTLALETADRAALLPLVGELQAQGLAVNRLAAHLSRDAARALRDELTRGALESLSRRAELTAASLGLKHTGWVELALDSPSPGPRPMYAEARAMSDAAPMPPALTVGTTTVRVTVRATARLEP